MAKMPNRLPPVYAGAFTALYPNASFAEFFQEHFGRAMRPPIPDKETDESYRHELLGYLLERWLAWRCNGTFDAEQAKDALWKNLERIALVDVDESE